MSHIVGLQVLAEISAIYPENMYKNREKPYCVNDPDVLFKKR